MISIRERLVSIQENQYVQKAGQLAKQVCPAIQRAFAQLSELFARLCVRCKVASENQKLFVLALDVEKEKVDEQINGLSLMHKAASRGHVKAIEALHKKGASLTAKTNIDNPRDDHFSPLGIAARHNQFAALRRMIELKEGDQKASASLLYSLNDDRDAIYHLLDSTLTNEQLGSEAELRGVLFTAIIAEGGPEIHILKSLARRLTRRFFENDKSKEPLAHSAVKRVVDQAKCVEVLSLLHAMGANLKSEASEPNPENEKQPLKVTAMTLAVRSKLEKVVAFLETIR